MKTYIINDTIITYYDVNGNEEYKEGFFGAVKEGYYSSENEYKLKCDVEFGFKLIAEFLIDNRLSPIAFNPQLSMSVLQKFQVVKSLAEVGDIKNVKLMLYMIETDELFTNERKDKYIQMCETYLNDKKD